MIEVNADVAVLGSGFAGSLTSLIVKRIGLCPVLIDKATHPRFAIGESSTPIANMVLRDLTTRYDLPQISQLAKYGTWQRAHPELVCGLKRGFSYFKHEEHQAFAPRADHANELLVTASADDQHSDTHWMRADVDWFLAELAQEAGIPSLDSTHIDHLREQHGCWRISGHRGDERIAATARFLVDATGEGGVVPRKLGISQQTDDFKTRSRAIYSHFCGVAPWHDALQAAGAIVEDHPFHCDDAAQHHILDGAWVWMLRFNNDVTSVGLVLDEGRFPLDASLSVEEEWSRWLSRYPSLSNLLRRATIVDPPGRLIRTRRLQRRWQRFTGRGWAALPNTAGFVDPLHSTGIAQALCGIERLVSAIEGNWNTLGLGHALNDYERAVFSELKWIDLLVAGCYASFPVFPLMAHYAMTYFTAATTYESHRAKGDVSDLGFLCANAAHYRSLVNELFESLPQPTPRSLAQSALEQFRTRVADVIKVYNHVGLCDPTALNMYHYTSAPLDSVTDWPAS